MDHKNKCEELLKCGVNIIDINHTYIDNDVKIGAGTTIYPNVAIRGNSIIGKDNVIDMNSIIVDSKIDNNNNIISSYIENSEVGNNNKIGPFSHIKDQTIITNDIIIGNFVEVKKSFVNERTKAKHLTYIGDVNIEHDVNIGAGVVFANYNPKTKEKTKTMVEENVNIGANSVLISPVTLKRSSIIAAGSTITEDVEEYALGIARSRQINKK